MELNTRFWVVSSSVLGPGTDTVWKPLIEKYRAAFMGWMSDDNNIGTRFAYNIRIGDIILIASRSNRYKELFAVGRVTSDALDGSSLNLDFSDLNWDFKGTYRTLNPFVKLHNSPSSYNISFEGAAFGNSSQPHAMYELKPNSNVADKKICQFLLSILEKSEYMQDLEISRQIILQGPPGTGKTYRAKQMAGQLLVGDPSAAHQQDHPMHNTFQQLRWPRQGGGGWAIVQFHPSYNYEDFVRGIQVIPGPNGGLDYKVVNRKFAHMAEVANKDREHKYVLIIDEINRANVAAVLGELIYALEYRDDPVDTPHAINGNATLVVPKNLYIIGTMNTADRSIGHIDYAIRRRFTFHALLPDRQAIIDSYGDNFSLSTLAIRLFDATSQVFTSTDQAECMLSPDYYADDVCVGHSYFMARDEQELSLKFRCQVIPILREYFKDGVLIEKRRGAFQSFIETLQRHIA